MTAENKKWTLTGHSYQVADTGDYDGCWEITDGKISLFTKDDDEESLQEVIDILNKNGIEFYQNDFFEYENRFLKVENQLLSAQLEELKTKSGANVPGNVPNP